MAGTALTRDVLDATAAAAAVSGAENGAVVLFIGTVRDVHQGRAVTGITYSAYATMAATRLERIAGELEVATQGLRVAIVHRLGRLAVGEASVVIATSSPHRDAAYVANRLALERLKREVPIWKREHYADGGAAWREVERLTVPEPAGALASRLSG